MSRHRNVRSMNYKDEYDGYDDVYGHSVEDDSCISPSDAAQWIYDRNNRGTTQHGIGSYLDANKDIPEEDEDVHEEFGRRDSVDLPQLSSLEKAKLASCLEEIKNVIGETIPERTIVEIIIEHDFDLTKSLDAALNSSNHSIKEEFVKNDNIEKDLLSNCKTKKPMSLKDLMHSANKESQIFQSMSSKLSNGTNLVDPKTEFTSLDELTSFHLKNNAGSNKFIIPKFNLNSAISKQVNEGIDLKSSNSNNCFLNQKLTDNSPNTNSLKFVIPKFNLNSANSNNDQSSFNSFKPAYETSRGNTSKNNANDSSKSLENWHIDLTSALKSISNQTSNKVVQNINYVSSSPDEKFIPQFIDCETEIFDTKILECCLNISYILENDFKYIKKKRSGFGKILCRTYRNAYRPIIKHDYEIHNQLKRFKFDIPSPDDDVQKYIRK